MFFNPARAMGCFIVLGSAVLAAQAPKAQDSPGAATASASGTGTNAVGACIGCELPITLRQNVQAGKTTVGTKVEARLAIATMMRGEVIPRGAVISGEVIESAAKSENSASRLAIRMDSAQWKNGGARLKMYITAWYYPPVPMAAPSLSYVPPGDKRNWGGVDLSGDRTDPPNPVLKISNQDTSVYAGPPATVISKVRVLMKNVESASSADGSLVLISRSNIKLNKVTTYVLATSEVAHPGK